MISSRNIQQTYDRFSSLYDLIFKPYLGFGRQKAIEILAPSADSLVLEVGVGTGLSLEYYPRNIEVVAFDYSFGMLKEAGVKAKGESHCRVDLLQMDVQNMAFADHSFACIMGAYVLTVVAEPEKAIKELFRVARPGARIVLINYVRSKNKIMGILESLFHPVFAGLGLFTLDHDIPGLLTRNGARNLKLEPTSFLNLHQIISFTTPE